MKNANSAAVISAAGDNTLVDNTTGSTLIGVRIPPNLLQAPDKWIADDDISRPEAIRQLVEFALIPKPGSLSVSSERVTAINSWVNTHEPGLSLPDAIGKLIEIGLRGK
jgi:hypothetical protein